MPAMAVPAAVAATAAPFMAFLATFSKLVIPGVILSYAEVNCDAKEVELFAASIAMDRSSRLVSPVALVREESILPAIFTASSYSLAILPPLLLIQVGELLRSLHELVQCQIFEVIDTGMEPDRQDDLRFPEIFERGPCYSSL